MSSPTTSATGRLARAALAAAACCSFALAGLAQLPVPPRARTLVSDFAGALAPANEAALERKLVAYDDSTSTQIAVVIERTTGGEPAFDRSFAIADAWGIGGRQDNGILLYVALDDRGVFIQTGYGVEDRVTDALARSVVEQVIVPNFRAGRYYEGIDRATDVFIDVLAGRYTAEPRARGGGGGLSPVATLLLFVAAFFLLSWLLSRGADDDDGDDGGYYRGGRYRGPARRGRGRGGMVILPGGGFGGGWGWGGGFGGGGGGFGGFGGGGFGGGGAGGSW